METRQAEQLSFIDAAFMNHYTSPVGRAPKSKTRPSARVAGPLARVDETPEYGGRSGGHRSHKTWVNLRL